MVILPETKRMLVSLAVKLGFGLLAFTAAFIAQHIGSTNVDPLIAAVVAALFGDISEWANARYELGSRVAKATGRLGAAVPFLSSKKKRR